jgi:hypothetical protein
VGCTFAVFHLQGNELDEGFVDDLLTLLQPGIDAMMSPSFKRASFKRSLEMGKWKALRAGQTGGVETPNWRMWGDA